jgi:hypothetical protein
MCKLCCTYDVICWNVQIVLYFVDFQMADRQNVEIQIVNITNRPRSKFFFPTKVRKSVA